MPTREERTAARIARLKALDGEGGGESTGAKLWTSANTPLTDLPSKAGKAVNDWINPEDRGGTLARYGGAFAESLGNTVSGMTSPLSLALLGTGAVAKSGATAVAPYAQRVLQGASAGMVGHGAYNAATGKHLDEKLGGAAEMVLGGVGMAGSRGMAPGKKPSVVEAAPEAPIEPVTDFTLKPRVEEPNVAKTPGTGTPQNIDVDRRATLGELRAYRSNPEQFDTPRAQALADNLVKRVGTPNAHIAAEEIYGKLKGKTGGVIEEVPRMFDEAAQGSDSPHFRKAVEDQNYPRKTFPEREGPLIGVQGDKLRSTGLETVDEIPQRGKGFAPESPEVIAQPPARAPRQRMFGGKVVKGSKGKKTTPPTPFAPREEAVAPVAENVTEPGKVNPKASQMSPVSEPIDPNRPFQKASDSDVKFLAKQGNASAQAELAARSKRQGLMSEIGAVGDIDEARRIHDDSLGLTKGPRGETGRTLLRNLNSRLKGVFTGDPEDLASMQGLIQKDTTGILKDKLVPIRIKEAVGALRDRASWGEKTFGEEPNVPGQRDELVKTSNHLRKMADSLEANPTLENLYSFRQRVADLLKREDGAVGDIDSVRRGDFAPKERTAAQKLEELQNRSRGDKAEALATGRSLFDVGTDRIQRTRDGKVRSIGSRLKSEDGFINLGGRSSSNRPLEEGPDRPRSKTLQAAEKHAPGFAEKFEDWVNTRRASKIEGIIKKHDFKELDAKGPEGIAEFQQGIRTGKYRDVQNYFDTKHQEVESSGIRAGFKENYLPQLWENPPDEVFDVARRLGLKPKFSLPSILENYQKGIEIGLKPKFKSISDLVGWYEQTANKAIADRQFFDHLVENGLIRPKGKAPANGTWASLSADHFPIQKFKTGNKEFQGVLMAPKEVADTINNYLSEPTNKVLDKTAAVASLSKNYALSSGIPGTGINAHGFNILARNVMANGLRGGAKMAKYMVSPKSAMKDLQQMMPTAPFAMKHGLTMSVEGFELGENNLQGLVKRAGVTGKLADNALLDFHNKYFERPLFQEIVPALKLKHFNDFYGELRKSGMGETQAAKSAAETTNNLYGGINWEAMGRSRDVQNLWRSILLAPDWFESNIRMGKGMAQAMRNPNTPQGRIYARVSKNLIAAYVSANVVNMASTGHPMWDNAPGHTLDIEAGKAGDKIRYVRPLGTAADFLRLPTEALLGAMKGDIGQPAKIMKNRTSAPLNAAGNIWSGVDDFGRKMTGKDEYGKPIPVGKQFLSYADQVTGPFVPQYVRNPTLLAVGKINPEQALSGTAEGPLRYAQGPKEKLKTRRRSRTR